MSLSIRNAEFTNSRIVGLGTYRPRREVTNAEVCEWILSSDEWITTRSGIRSRRFAGQDETLSAMAIIAGRRALEHAGIDADELDGVIVASMSNLVQTPPLAISVAVGLGAVTAGGFDVSAACAGFCHALAVASDAVRTGGARYVMVIGVERMSDIVDRTDREIAFLFADGAGAVVVGRSKEPGISSVVRGADHHSLDALRMSITWEQFRADPTLTPPAMKMDGRRVFRWALGAVVPAARLVLQRAGLEPSDLAAFIPHQANLRMIEVLATRLGLPDHVAVARDIESSGNTSAASIPLAMERLLCSGAANPGGAALLMGFGAGMNYAGQVVALPPAPAAGRCAQYDHSAPSAPASAPASPAAPVQILAGQLRPVRAELIPAVSPTLIPVTSPTVSSTGSRTATDVGGQRLPDGVQPDSYREAMRQLASGVTVVTTTDRRGDRFGFTASSFVPVSMEPPLVLVCIARSARSFEVFHSCTRFVVSVLADRHREVADRFSRSLADKFGVGQLTTTPDGMPAVDGALSTFECETTSRQDAGDHMILMGRIYRLRSEPGHPMVYFDRGFRRLEGARRTGDATPAGAHTPANEPAEIAS